MKIIDLDGKNNLDFTNIKVFYGMLDKLDKSLVMRILFKYRDELELTNEELQALSLTHGIEMSGTLKGIIATQIEQVSETDLKAGLLTALDYLKESDLSVILNMSFLPEKIKEIIGGINNVRK
jgi:hypothetical protein